MRTPKRSEVKAGLAVRVFGPDFDYDARMWNGECGYVVGPSKLSGGGIEHNATYLFEVKLGPGDPERVFHFRQLRVPS